MPETRERIQQIIKQVDYHPKAYAKAISNQRSEMICMVLPYSLQSTFLNPYYTEVLRGIATITQEQGYQLMFIYSGKGEYMLAAKQQRADGIILVNPTENDYQNIQELDDMGFPIVLASRVIGLPHINCVYMDDHRASVLAVEHLISRNHRNIALISVPKELVSGSIRLQGYKDTLEKHGIPFREDYVITCDDVCIENGMYAMKKFLEIPEITAVYATDDVLAIGAIRAINEQGKSVPEDFSIVGFDDQPISQYLSPALTTIHHDAFERGAIAAKMLFDKINNKPVKGSHVMDVQLVIRDSTKEI